CAPVTDLDRRGRSRRGTLGPGTNRACISFRSGLGFEGGRMVCRLHVRPRRLLWVRRLQGTDDCAERCAEFLCHQRKCFEETGVQYGGRLVWIVLRVLLRELIRKLLGVPGRV